MYLVKNIEFCELSDEKICQVIQSLQPDVPVILVTRKFAGWSNQGKITPNVIQRNTEMQTKVVDNSIPDDLFQIDQQYVVFIDKLKKLAPSQIASTFAMVTPSLMQEILKRQEKLYSTNDKILEAIDNLPGKQWRVDNIDLSQNLSAYTITARSKR